MTSIAKPYIKFAKLNAKGILPEKKEENSGFDIYPCIDKDYFINAYTTRGIPTGIASEIPKDWTFVLFERGSTGSVGIKRSAGVMDSGYRGEWVVFLTNSTYKTVVISVNPERTKSYLLTLRENYCKRKYGTNYDPTLARVTEFVEKNYIIYPATKAIAQALLVFTPHIDPQECAYEELSSSERGVGKLGSTGK